MPTQPKPFTVLVNEKKSHRTKAELKQRKQEEAALSSGTALRVRPEVKQNAAAYKEYLRINKLLKGMEKNDALYEPVINRYCLIQAECGELEERREFFFQLIEEVKERFDQEGLEVEQLLELTKELGKLTSGMMAIDKVLQQKRKMLFDIEKENIMTVASALRSIPKVPEKQKNPLLKALSDD